MIYLIQSSADEIFWIGYIYDRARPGWLAMRWRDTEIVVLVGQGWRQLDGILLFSFSIHSNSVSALHILKSGR